MATSPISIHRPSSSSSPSFSSPSSLTPRLKHPQYTRPRVPFCWVCSQPLEEWIHRTCIVHGNEVICHVRCASRERLEIKPGERERLSMALAKLARSGNQEREAIIQCACRGERMAIGAVAAVFGPTLYAEAKAVLGERAREADIVLDDFFDSLCEVRTRFPPAHGRGVEWMKGIVRAIARVQITKGGQR